MRASNHHLWVPLLVALTSVFTGCSGTIASGNPEVARSLSCNGQFALTQDSPLVRISAEQYRHTIEDVLPMVTLDAELPIDGATAGFLSNAGTPLTDTHIRAYSQVAESIAAQATQNMNTLLGCDPAQAGEDTCVANFIDTVGRRLYRRPLSSEEKQGLLTNVYQPMKADSGFVSAVGMTLQAMLLSANFLHRVEIGAAASDIGANTFVLNDYEIAARLASLLWLSSPDDTLLDEAKAGRVHTSEQIEAQARRMLQDAKSKRGIRSVHMQIFRIPRLDTVEKDATKFSGFGPELKASMKLETQMFIDRALWEGQGDVKTLLTGHFGFVDAKLADIYGVAKPSGTDPAYTEFDATKGRSGILTQAAFLAGHANRQDPSVVQRGLTIRHNLLCQELAAPPPGVDMNPDAPRLTNPACASCHRMMDLIGQGLNRYDAIGRYSDTANNQPIAQDGEIISTTIASPTFQGPLELTQRLADSNEYIACMAKQWFRFTFSKQAEELDNCEIERLTTVLTQSNGDVRELLVNIATSGFFRARRAAPVESCQ